MNDLLRSKLKAKLLAYLFAHQNEEFYIRELARIIKDDPTNVSRTAAKLGNEGIVKFRKRGKEKFIRLNKEYLLYTELKNIVAKTVGAENQLKEILRGVPRAMIAFIYGSFARDEAGAESDIDIYVIGERIDKNKLVAKIAALEKKIGRDISYKVIAAVDFQERLRQNNSFLLNILRQKKVFLIGDEANLRKFIKQGNIGE